MVSLKDPSLSNHETWSFCGPMGKSAPDHILIPKNQQDKASKLKIHQDISCGSDHRLATILFTGGETENCNLWGDPEIKIIEWNVEEIEKYQTHILRALNALRTEPEKPGLKGERRIKYLTGETTRIIKASTRSSADIQN